MSTPESSTLHSSGLDAIEELRPVDVSPPQGLKERLDVLVAFSALLFVDGVMKLAGFQRFYRMLRSWPVRQGRPPDVEAVATTCSAVDRAATYYFKRAWCLQRSATAVCLLRLRGVDAKLNIGVQKIPFYAHAWVEVDDEVVNDHPQVQKRYTVLERC